MKALTTLLLLIALTSCSFAQESGAKVAPVLSGTWLVDNRMPAVNLDELDATSKSNSNDEILGPTVKEVTFDDGKFTLIESKKKGAYSFKGNDLILNGVSYKCAYYSDDKFSLMRFVNPNRIYSYMLERKK